MKTKGIDQMPEEELRNRLKMFGSRALHLCGVTPDGTPLGVAVKKFFDEVLLSTSDPEKIKERNEFFDRAQKDIEARNQLCGIRVETMSNYILASVNIMSMFFEIVNLAEDERPVFQNTTDQEVLIAAIGADGGLTAAKVVKDDDETLISLQWLATQRLRYRAVDIYRGRIVDQALKTLRLAYDIKNQIDAQCYALLTDPNAGAFGGVGLSHWSLRRFRTANVPPASV